MPFAPSPTQQAYNDALLAAREDWLKEEEVTVAAIQQAYGKAVNDMAFDLAAMDAQGRQVIRGPATRAWYDEIRVNLDGYRQNISAQTLAATRNGIVLAYNTGLSTGDVHTDYLDAYTQGGHSISMLGLKESEALSYYARNGKNGVVLSDKVWGSTAKFQTDMSTAIQTAVISGQSARDLARELDNMVLRHPEYGVVGLKPISAAQKRALGWSGKADGALSYQSVRVARTEINTAGREGSIAVNSRSPFYLGVVWRRSNAAYPCPICERLSQGAPGFVDPITGENFWPKGMEPSSAHPNCRCAVLPVYDDPSAQVRSLENWINDPVGSPGPPEFQTWVQGLDQAGLLGPVSPPKVVPPKATRARKPKPQANMGNHEPTRIPDPTLDPVAEYAKGAAAFNDGQGNATAGQYKDRIANELTDRLVLDPAFRDLVAQKQFPTIWRTHLKQPGEYSFRGVYPKTEAELVDLLQKAGKTQAQIDDIFRQHTYAQANDMVHQWAVTSADDNSTSLALQIAAKEEFKLGNEARTAHFSRRQAYKRAQAEYAEHGAGYRAFTRAVYDNTQADLVKQGITEVTAYRGAGFTSAKQAAAAGIPASADGAVVQAANLKLQPISSFSYSWEVSTRFTSGSYKTMQAVTIPRERIFSTMKSGTGCKEECEFVVFGGPTPANVGAGHSVRDLPTAKDLLEGKRLPRTPERERYMP